MKLFSSFKYATIRVQANLSAFELSTDDLLNKYGISVQILDINNDDHVATWCDIINHSYSEFNYNIDSARLFLNDDKYYSNRVTYIYIYNGEYCATVSVGTYKRNPKVGGAFKFGVKKECQGRGLGGIAILYAFSRLKERGLEIGESSILITRKTSLYLHFKLGFRPQYNPKYFALPASSDFFYRIIKVIPLLKLKLEYRKFINAEKRKFIVK